MQGYEITETQKKKRLTEGSEDNEMDTMRITPKTDGALIGGAGTEKESMHSTIKSYSRKHCPDEVESKKRI